MLHALNRFLTSRRTAITLIVVLLALTSLGYVLPQQGTDGLGPNRFDLPTSLLTLSSAAGLDRMWSSPLYLGTLGACLIALLAALLQSGRTAWKRTFQPVVGAGSRGALHTHMPAEETASLLRARGYRPMPPAGTTSRFMKHPWGLWGGFILHLGLVVSVAFALIVLSTESWAIIGLVEGETLEPGGEWSNSEPGPFSDHIVLPETLRLDKVTPTYWDNDELRQITSDLTFIAPDGTEYPLQIAVNHSKVRNGVRFYQDQRFGRSFFLEVTDGEELRRERVEMEWAWSTEEPVYFDLELGPDRRLQLKYYADVERASLTGEPELWARYAEGDERSAEAVLPVDIPIQVGPLVVELKLVRSWANIIVMRDHGVPVLFAGFFLVFIGSALIYLTVPREAFVSTEDGTTTVHLRAIRFPDMYAEEIDTIAESLLSREDQPDD